MVLFKASFVKLQTSSDLEYFYCGFIGSTALYCLLEVLRSDPGVKPNIIDLLGGCNLRLLFRALYLSSRQSYGVRSSALCAPTAAILD